MNERIRELAEQADLYARSDNSSMLFENYQKRYTEKFAELIVKECGSYLNSPEFIGRSDLNWAMVLNEHFRVEE